MKKIPFCNIKLLKKINNFYLGKINIIKTWSRNSTILPKFIGLTIYVYNGQKHIPIMIKEDMVNHKLGEFSFTRKFIKHSKKNNNVNIKSKIKK
ncbi:30S ribosomal protein S19 [Candidatus Vidania fulgoroideorum]